MPCLSQTPADVSISPRNREYDIARSLGRDWFDHHAFKTAWFNAMSITFPLGEKFFIDSVRHFSDQIDDPKLHEDIRGFCGQEGFHRREHQRYNETLCEQRGYDLAKMEGRLEKNIKRAYKMLSPLERLATTAAFEHITAIMAESALADDNPMTGLAEPVMQELWDWHAAEEMEHKSVAFDVFRAVGGSEALRKRAMRGATTFLLLDVLVGLVEMLVEVGDPVQEARDIARQQPQLAPDRAGLLAHPRVLQDRPHGVQRRHHGGGQLLLPTEAAGPCCSPRRITSPWSRAAHPSFIPSNRAS